MVQQPVQLYLPIHSPQAPVTVGQPMVYKWNYPHPIPRMGHSLFETASGLPRMALETVGLLGWVQGEREAWGGGGDELNMKLQQRPHLCLPENWELSVPNTPNAEQEGLSVLTGRSGQHRPQWTSIKKPFSCLDSLNI